jgi:hypothetical protein
MWKRIALVLDSQGETLEEAKGGIGLNGQRATNGFGNEIGNSISEKYSKREQRKSQRNGLHFSLNETLRKLIRTFIKEQHDLLFTSRGRKT